MLWTGGAPDAIGGGSLSPLVTTRNCAAQLRSMCRMDSPAQTRAMACTTTATCTFLPYSYRALTLLVELDGKHRST